MVYCSKCGAEVKGSFCSNCGNPVNALSVQEDSSYNESKVYSVGDFTYTDEDLKYYENKLNSEILKCEKFVKSRKYSNYIVLGFIAFLFIHWNITTGFWNAALTFFLGFFGMWGFISAKATEEHNRNKLEKLKQHNPYTFMMEKVAEAKNNEKRMQNIATGIQAANVGLKIFNILNRL